MSQFMVVAHRSTFAKVVIKNQSCSFFRDNKTLCGLCFLLPKPA